MKKLIPSCLLFLCALAACTDDATRPQIASTDIETVQLVLYFSDGDQDFNSVGETLLLNTGETMKVERNVIRPGASITTQDWNGRFLPATKGPLQPGTVELRVDRSNGVICKGEICAFLYDICPHISALESGQKCRTFVRKQEH